MLGQSKAARAVASILVAGGLLASGCQTNREVTRPEPEPVTADLLTESLLTQDDVPSPYVLDAAAEDLGPEIVPEHECDDPLSAIEPDESVSVTFTGSGIGSTLTNTIAYYPGAGAQVTDAYVDVLEDCAQVVVTDAGMSFRTTPLDFGVLSDDTFPIVAVLEYDTGTIEERNAILIRAGDLTSTIYLNGPRPTDLEVLDEVTRVAIGNLGLLEQAT